MDKLVNKIKSATVALGCIVLGISQASASGLMTATNGSAALQIQDHQVSVSIEDGYAITTVENTFYNPSQTELEAIYEFPVPKNGTVAEFTVWIDGVPIIGEVVEKERAQQLYQTEKAAGRDVGLAEKKSIYRFETKVSPVRPLQNTKTRLVYMQAADVEGGIGRYVYPLEDGGTDKAKLDFWQSNDVVTGNFSFDLNLRSGFPIEAVRAPAHTNATISSVDANNWMLAITETGKNKAAKTQANTIVSDFDRDRNADFENAQTQTSNTNRLNQDIVVYWRLQQNLPGAIELVAHREPGARRGTYMMTVTPGIDLQPITEGRDWVFVLDRSGSMDGKYETLMDATSEAIKRLSVNDRFQVILFDDQVESLSNGWMSSDQVSIQKIQQALNNSAPRGGTNLYRGLSSAMNKLDQDRTSSIVLITDGVANVGKTEKADFIDLMSQKDVRLFTAIMGNGANRPMLESMTQASKGFATNVSNSDDILGVMISAVEKVKYQALHDVTLNISGVKTKSMVASKGTTLYRGQQMVIFGHYFGDGNATATLNAKISGERKQYKTDFRFPKQAIDNPEIERLWAYAKIEQLKNKSNYLGSAISDQRSAIVNIATEYGLVTDFTSMIVMSDEQFKANGIKRNNKERRKAEQTAQTKRAKAPVQQRQVDQSSPTFSHQRPSYSGGGGGGSVNPLSLIILLPLALTFMRRRITRATPKAPQRSQSQL